MTKITFLFVLIIFLPKNGFCQENISFPLEIGNKFFYNAGHFPDNGYYGAIKTITDTLSDGTRIISFKKFYTNSTTTENEYWFYSDKKLYASSSPSSFYYPVFDGYLLNDTCTYIGLPSRCYSVFDSVLFNINSYCQSYSDGFFSHGSGNSINIYTANNIGIYFRLLILFDNFPPDEKDSITLIGFTSQGVLVGDSILTDVSDPYDFTIKSFQLYQNYPNPFNPTTKISWQSPVSGWQTLKVYDVLGNEVATLVNEYKPAGSYEVEFKSTVGSRQLANGVYFYQLKVDDYVETKKMIFLK